MKPFEIDSVDSRIVITGRNQTYLENPEKGTLPPSCAMLVYNNNPGEGLSTASKYLRFGAGVKMPLDFFHRRNPIAVDWWFYLSPDHPDFKYMTSVQQGLFRSIDYCSDEVYVIKVQDSMETIESEEGVGIEESWTRFIEAAELGRTILLDLSSLRPNGTTNSKGLLASGPLGSHVGVPADQVGKDSFLSIYEHIAAHLESGDIISLMQLFGHLCEVIRRGNAYKAGIICTALDFRHTDFQQYLNFPLADLAGSQKKSVRFDWTLLGHPDLMDAIAEKVNQESIFLEKIQGDDLALYANVCMGIRLKDRGACLVGAANAGRCIDPNALVEAYVAAVKFYCELHVRWRNERPEKATIYRPLAEDQQIAVGWLGFANFLRQQGVTYVAFADALHAIAHKLPYSLIDKSQKAWLIADAIRRAYRAAYEFVVENYPEIQRFATIEPTQRCWVDERNKDLAGFYACRNIDPPLLRRERRDSDRYGEGKAKWYNHGLVETLSDVPHDIRQMIWEDWMIIATEETHGRNHGGSFDLTKPVDRPWIVDFIIRSSLPATYYQQAYRLDQSSLDKGLIPQESTIDCACGT